MTPMQRLERFLRTHTRERRKKGKKKNDFELPDMLKTADLFAEAWKGQFLLDKKDPKERNWYKWDPSTALFKQVNEAQFPTLYLRVVANAVGSETAHPWAIKPSTRGHQAQAIADTLRAANPDVLVPNIYQGSDRLLPLKSCNILNLVTGDVFPRTVAHRHIATIGTDISADDAAQIWSRGDTALTTDECLDLFPVMYPYLLRLMGGSHDQLMCLQTVLGYWMTGLTTLKKFFELFGLAGNGKSVLMRAISLVLGRQDNSETLGRHYCPLEPEGNVTNSVGSGGGNREKRNEWASSGSGTRLVIYNEAKKNCAYKEENVKAMASGSDDVGSRLLFNNSKGTTITAKYAFPVNGLPKYNPTDTALSDRLFPIIFPVRFVKNQEEYDIGLEDTAAIEAQELSNLNPGWWPADQNFVHLTTAAEQEVVDNLRADGPRTAALVYELFQFILHGCRRIFHADGSIRQDQIVPHPAWTKRQQSTRSDSDEFTAFVRATFEVLLPAGYNHRSPFRLREDIRPMWETHRVTHNIRGSNVHDTEKACRTAVLSVINAARRPAGQMTAVHRDIDGRPTIQHLRLVAQPDADIGIPAFS